MRNNKFFVSLLLVFALFAAAFVMNGCGGSSNNTGRRDEAEIPVNDDIFTVTFNSNGGTDIPSQQIEYGGIAQMPEAPVRSGYIFVGWYTDNNTFRNMFLFGENGDKITQNITLNAQWLEDNPELYRAEYALSEIVIGYADGDNSKHVTRDLTLQENSGGTAITWTSSNPGVVSTAGRVNRPQGSDTDVTLTAAVSTGNASRSREFTVKVIHAHTRQREEIHNSTIADIENMNVSNDELYISYNSDRTQVTNIEGKYSDIVIENADDALDAVYGVRSILGLSNPYEELESSVTTSDSYGGEYSFRQVYNGVRVYGRSVMASANASGEADFLSSSVIASDVLDGADMRAVLTAEQAEEAALKNYTGDVVTLSSDTELVVFSLPIDSEHDYQASPVYAYCVNVCGITEDKNYVSETVFVSASSGEPLIAVPNILTASNMDYVGRMVSAKGIDELRNTVSFDVAYKADFVPQYRQYVQAYHMHDIDTNVKVYRMDMSNSIYFSDNYSWNSDFNYEFLGIPVMTISEDGQHISAYRNMVRILRWWKDIFNRDSLNDKGMEVSLIVHASIPSTAMDFIRILNPLMKENVKIIYNNALWDPLTQTIAVYDKDERYNYSFAVALDVLTHESAHAVMQYMTYCPVWGIINKVSGAISEGYADVFGCLIEGYEYDEQKQSWKLKNDPPETAWQFGEILYQNNCMRNAADPHDERIKAEDQGISHVSEYSNKIDIHQAGTLIPHCAYLMYKGGLDWQTLGQVWYRSMRFGLNLLSNFQDVRRCVVRAARKLNLSAEQLAVIKNAFDEVGIEGASGTLSGKITDKASGYAVQGASVNAILNSVIPLNAGRQTTGSDGKYSLTLEYSRSKYLINISAANYVEFFAMQAVEENEDTQMDVALVRPGTGSGSLIVRSAVDDSPISGVTLNFRSGWNMRPENSSPFRTGDLTGENGQFSFENIPSGYYTVEMIKDGYAVSYANITIAPGSNSTQTGYLSPTMSDSEYRIVLSWGANPSDLDSHLEGTHPNGDYAHVYFGNQSGSVNGKDIYLDIDDTSSYGPETITFEADPESSYEYYIVWYAGSGTWKDSEAVINVYNGTRHVAVYTVPEADNSSGRWSVFKITRGIFAPTNEIIY